MGLSMAGGRVIEALSVAGVANTGTECMGCNAPSVGKIQGMKRTKQVGDVCAWD